MLLFSSMQTAIPKIEDSPGNSAISIVGIILAGAAMEALTILRIVYRTCIFKAFVGLEASQDFYMLTATQGVRGVSCWCCGCCVSFKNTIVVLYV